MIKKAFSLIELSIVMIIIGLIISGIIGGQNLIALSRLSSAQTLTNSSPVNSTEDLVLWIETTSKSSFDKSDRVDNAVVSDWYDINPQSTSKHHLRQTTSGREPLYIKNGINNLPSIRFAGTNDSLVDTGKESDLDIATPTMFLVSSGSGTYTAKNQSPNSNSARKLQTTQNAFISGANGSDVSFTYPSGATKTDVHIRVLVSKSNTDHIMYIDGTQKITSSIMYHDQFNDAAFRIGSAFTDTAENLTGDIGEVIIFNRALSTFEVEQIMNYLSKKWKIDLD